MDARPMAASVTRDGERLAVLLATKSTRGGQERRLEVWDIGTGTRVATREFEPMLDADRAAYLEFAGDDGYLVIGTRQGVDVVDADRLEPVATIFHPGVRLTAMQSDATLVATTAGGGTVRVWDTGNGAEIARIEPPETVIVMVLSDDDRWLATLSDAGTVRLWSLTAGDLIRQACRWLPEPCP